MASLRNKFQGSLVGAVIGDCLGAYWELKSWRGTHRIDEVKAKISDQVYEYKRGKGPVISYTDDSAMTLTMAQSLVGCQKFDHLDMAKRFTEEYFTNTNRGYGASVSTVFIKLRKCQFEDVYGPAQQQFQGEGSCGNGGAMRISPAALYGYNDDATLIEVVRDSTRLTHAHISGINGALLQAMAIKHAMKSPVGSLDKLEFVSFLYESIQKFEERMENLTEENAETTLEQKPSNTAKDQTQAVPTNSSSSNPVDPRKVKMKMLKGQPCYTSCLDRIRGLLLQPETPTADDVEQLLGHGVLAGESVASALYAFLHCSSSSFRDLIPYAISLGGDADTIASMAGAIGGAYWGIEAIPDEWMDCCEATETARKLGDDLYNLVIENKAKT